MSGVNNKLTEQDLESVSGSIITPEEAYAAALEHAGLAQDQIQLVKKIELDFEHGRRIYEVEFYHNGLEYEFDIDAKSGKIMKFEKGWD